MCESRATVSALVPWLCDLAVIEEQEPRIPHFPATRIQTRHRRIIWELLRRQIAARNLQVAFRMPPPSRPRIVSEQFLTLYTPIPRLLLLVVVEKLELHIHGVAKWACLGDTHIHGRLHGSFGPPHFGSQVSRDDVWTFEKLSRSRDDC